MSSIQESAFKPVAGIQPPSAGSTDRAASSAPADTASSNRCIILLTVLIAALFALFRLLLLRYYGWDIRNWPHDDLMQARNASALLNGQWLGAYDNCTLAKVPGFAFALAASCKLHLPWYLFMWMIILVSAGAWTWAIYPLILRVSGAAFTHARSRQRALCALLLLCWIAVLFNPIPYMAAARMYRNSLSAWIALLVFSGLFGTYLRRNESFRKILPWILITAVSLAYNLLLREDAFWILIPAAAATAVTWIAGIRHRRTAGKILLLAVLVLPFACAAAGTQAVAAVNAHVYGIRAVSDRSETSFSEMMGLLYQIDDPENTEPDLWLSQRAFFAAQEVSPGLAAMDLPAAVKEWVGNPDSEVNGDMMTWVIRDAAQAIGYYQDAVETEAFYAGICSDLEDAFSSGALPAREGWNLTNSTRPLTADDFAETIRMGFLDVLVFSRYPNASVDLSRIYLDDPVEMNADEIAFWEWLLRTNLPKTETQLLSAGADPSAAEQNEQLVHRIAISARIWDIILRVYKSAAMVLLPLSLLAMIALGVTQLSRRKASDAEDPAEDPAPDLLLFMAAILLSVLLNTFVTLLFARFMSREIGFEWHAYYTSPNYVLMTLWYLMGVLALLRLSHQFCRQRLQFLLQKIHRRHNHVFNHETKEQ